MFYFRSQAPDFAMLRTVALTLLAAEMLTIVLLILPGAPVLSKPAVLGFLGLVFVATIVMFRLPLPGILRMAMLVSLLLLLLTVAVKSDPFGLAASNAKMTEAVRTQQLAMSVPSLAPEEDQPVREIGARVVVDRSEGMPLVLDRRLGGPEAQDFTIRVAMSAQRDASHMIQWSIERDGKSAPCGRTTAFGSGTDIPKDLTVSFEQAIEMSSREDKLVCY